METILLYNECVPLPLVQKTQRFTLEDGTCVHTLALASEPLELPLTGKLLQFLKSRGINVAPTVTIGDSWVGPTIYLGFESFNVASSSHKGYLQLWCFDMGFDLDNDDDERFTFKKHNVSLRIDIDALTDDVSKCHLKPDVMSHVVEWRGNCVFAFPKHDVCVTFKSARTSTVNDDLDKLLQNWTRSDSNWKLTMSLSLILTPKSETHHPDPDVFDCLIPNKRMRMNPDETFADFTIITGDGTRVKCHRAVLAAQSPYFAGMLKSDMKEARTGTVELAGMTVEGVGAMLDYFYTSNVAVLEGNALVCVELLEAGHQYDIQPLEKCTKKFLLSKASDWYTPEAALRLMLYMKDMDMFHMFQFYHLKKKAVKVFKKMFPEIQKLPAYEKLWKENPEVLKQLLEFALK